MSIVLLCSYLSSGQIDTSTFLFALSYIMSHGCKIDEIDSDGDSGLHKLVQISSTYIEASRKMIQLGSDVNLISEKNMTPLYLAVSLYSVDMVRLLIAAGADPHMKISEKGTTPYSLNTAMVKLIEDETKWSTLGHRRNRISDYLNYNPKIKPNDTLSQMIAAEIKKEQRVLVRDFVLNVCIAFQTLELPAFVSMTIIDSANYSFKQIPMHIKWDMITFIKHWKK